MAATRPATTKARRSASTRWLVGRCADAESLAPISMEVTEKPGSRDLRRDPGFRARTGGCAVVALPGSRPVALRHRRAGPSMCTHYVYTSHSGGRRAIPVAEAQVPH